MHSQKASEFGCYSVKPGYNAFQSSQLTSREGGERELQAQVVLEALRKEVLFQN